MVAEIDSSEPFVIKEDVESGMNIPLMNGIGTEYANSNNGGVIFLQLTFQVRDTVIQS